MAKKVLVLGSGGREHALAWKLAQSEKVGKVFIASGNAGTSKVGENITINPRFTSELIRFIEREKIDLTVVGPEYLLEDGIVDAFKLAGFPIFGPTKKAARIEWSKAFAKRLMKEEGIPTADFEIFRKGSVERIYLYDNLEKFGMPVVIKDSGLAGGKGVFVCHTRDGIEKALSQLTFADEIIAEKFLSGREVSIHALCDGETSVLFPPSQDCKPLYSGGPNTGGMGVYAPVPLETTLLAGLVAPWLAQEIMGRIKDKVVAPALERLKKWRCGEFIGCLYPGLMVTSKGFKVLEFNARFGDPETQAYSMLFESDLYDALEACVEGWLSEIEIKWRPGAAVCVVLASEGYPGQCKTEVPIYGLNEAAKLSNVEIFHAATKFQDGRVVTNGGRVLSVTAHGKDIQEARERAYEAVRMIKFEGMYFRSDIGKEA